MLRLAKPRFTCFLEDSGYGATFPALDAMIQIFKEPVKALPEGMPYAALACSHESDNRSGGVTVGQVDFIYSKAFDLSTVNNPVLAWDSLKKQNQDDLGAIEYSVDGGTNWAPVIYYVDGGHYKSDPPDAFINAALFC